MKTHVLALLVLLALLAPLGCTKAPEVPPLAPVTGTVTLDGKPLAAATVTYFPTDPKGHGASGVTDGEGKYELTHSSGQKGAVKGDYRVVVSLLLAPDGSPIGGDPTKSPTGATVGRESLPPRFSSPQETTLKASVPEAGGTQDFTVEAQ